MIRMHTALAVATFLVMPAAGASAQTAKDVTGHWEGKVEIPGQELAFEIDIAREGPALVGAIGIPSQQLLGIPLQFVKVDGKIVTFQARTDQTFSGALSDDGVWIVGEFSIQGFTPPFTLKNVGSARMPAPLTSAPISRELAGSWAGTLEADGKKMHLKMTLTNHPNGTATGIAVSEDEGGIQIPVTITERDHQVTMTAQAVGSRFEGTLNAQGTELQGTWSQSGIKLPLTLTRAGAAAK